MIQQSVSLIAAAIVSFNYHGTALAANPVPSNSEDIHHTQKVENKELPSSKLKEFLRLHWFDLEYFTTISITFLAIVIGTGRSLKHQKSTAKGRQKASSSVKTRHTEDLKARKSPQISSNTSDRITQTQTTRSDHSNHASVSVEAKPLGTTDKKSLEEQEYYYRKKYQKLQERVRKSPQFANNSTWDVDPWEIDVEIARIVLLESLGDKEELNHVLRQSDRAIDWEISLLESEYQAKVSEYIEKIYNWAHNLHKLRQQNLSED